MKPRHASAAIAATCAAVLACGGSSGPSNTFVAQLNGANEAPQPVSTSATGTATFTRNGGTVSYNVSATGLSANATGAHIHIGPTGQAGPIIVDIHALTPAVGTSPSMTGTFTEANIKNPTSPPLSTPITTMDQLFDAIRAGNAYFNIHTTAHTGGEIRGQLTPQ
jgi:hypothetical protein